MLSEGVSPSLYVGTAGALADFCVFNEGFFLSSNEASLPGVLSYLCIHPSTDHSNQASALAPTKDLIY